MHTTTSAAIGANVRAEMARRGMMQQELATAIGLSQPGLSKRIRGVVPFDVDELAAIAAVLNIDPLDLWPSEQPVAS